MALEIPTTVERSHMKHPDFGLAGKIFASLGVPDKNWGMVKLTPELQRALCARLSMRRRRILLHRKRRKRPTSNIERPTPNDSRH
jgi:hypothetical protein